MIDRLLEIQAEAAPTAVAIAAPRKTPLSFGELHAHVKSSVAELRQRGFGRQDRLAVVLPNGPEMAVTFLIAAAAAACAPLNPAYRADEFEFYLSDLRATGLIIQADLDSPAVAAAQKLRIPILRVVSPPDASAGVVSFIGDGRRVQPASDDRDATPDDVALLLHTSGTTSRPKLVPLTHANIRASAMHIKESLRLSPEDRCLNVMPLFHIHGLVGAVLSSLTAGASVVCTAGFHPARFFAWLDEHGPTWYTAVPTIHQTIASRAPHHLQTVQRSRLRFIRSSSAALPAAVMLALEKTFGIPVIEAYGMTEASHQIATNPLPPRQRKPGSVGLAAGCEIATMTDDGRLLERGETGEIVIRGSNVTRGYEDNPDANRSAFTNGWFRTGDQGVIDADGHLSITGRLKEIINRGGEKISPREVDEILLDHPQIAQAVTFAMPHRTLGEEIAAAVVLREGSPASEADIRAFAAERLVEFKVPRRIVIVPEIPTGPTGKLQRIGLAAKLGLGDAQDPASDRGPSRTERVAAGRGGGLLPAAAIAPRDAVERRLAAIWERVLDVRPIATNHGFFDLGGYSLLAVELVEEIAREFGTQLPLGSLLQAHTVEQQAEILRREKAMQTWNPLVRIKGGGSRPPFYCVHTVGGNLLGYRALVHYLAPDQPVYGFQTTGISANASSPRTIEQMASQYVDAARAFQPRGPYFLGGQSFGGMVAFEMARQLQEQGEQVGVLALFDTIHFGNVRSIVAREAQPGRLQRIVHRAGLEFARFVRGPRRLDDLRRLTRAARRRWRNLVWKLRFPQFRKVQERNRQALSRFTPKPYPGKVTLFLASEHEPGPRQDPRAIWDRLALGGVETWDVPGDHVSITTEPHVRVLAGILQSCLDVAGAELREVEGPPDVSPDLQPPQSHHVNDMRVITTPWD